MTSLQFDLLFPKCDEKPTKSGDIIRYGGGLCVSHNDALAKKLCLTPELSSDENSVGGTGDFLQQHVCAHTHTHIYIYNSYWFWNNSLKIVRGFFLL